MTPKEALWWHITSVFPSLAGFSLDPLLTWKAVVFLLCWFLAWRNPLPYFWSLLALAGMVPAFALFAQGDPVSVATRIYLVWVCLEVSYRSVATVPQARISGWWLWAVVGLLLL